MKIRHKQSGVELEGAFIECGEGGPCIPSVSYFACERYGSRYDMREWEAVQEWVNVTAECELDVCGYLYHGARRVPSEGYRFRKVNLYAGYCSTEQQAAFIIEQRQP